MEILGWIAVGIIGLVIAVVLTIVFAYIVGYCFSRGWHSAQED